MDILTGIILGALQGFTEFLPISSSGHLVLAEYILGNKASSGLLFEVLVHFATMISVLIYFRKKIWNLIKSLFPPYSPEKRPFLRLCGIIVLGTIPAVVIGLAFQSKIEAAFNSPRLVLVMLLITGIILLSTRLKKSGNEPVGFKSGFLVGIAQSAALLPGISRSGSTIAAGLHLNLAPAEAAEYSFLLSLPAVFGAAVLKSFTLLSNSVPVESLGAYLVGAIVALVVGYISIAWLMRIMARGRFFYFGIYCVVIALAGMIIL